jgi:RimJ/RimL family protein N-acetyltransferase
MDIAAAPEALELMRMHVEALFVHDARSRIECTNEWTPRVASRFFLGRTRAGNLWRFSADLPDGLAAELEKVCRDEPVSPELPHLPANHDAYLRLLGSQRPIERVWSGPAYWSPTRSTEGASATEITAENASLLRGGLDAWLPDVPHLRPFYVAVEEGRAVSVCASVRITPAAHEAGVETLPAFRRRGHALCAVAAWAEAVRRLGVVPLYSTSWENRASQAVAARLGLAMLGVDFSVA